MRFLVAIFAAIVSVIVVSAVVAAVGNGRDHTGDTVRVQGWADDTCGTVGAWEGQLEAIRDELRLSNFGARRSDGGTGDSVEQTISIRTGVDRAIKATHDVLHVGLTRAGIPDANQGAQASKILLDWAQRTEDNLVVAKHELAQKPASPADAFHALLTPVDALALAAVDGRAAFKQVASLDPALSDALDGSRNCRDLMEEQP